MPTKKKLAAQALAAISKELIDQFVRGPMTAEAVNAVGMAFKKALIERALGGEPALIPKHERRFTGFDDKVIAMYARGMTMREIQGFLLESYGVEVSPEFISSVTDAVMSEVVA